MVADADAASPDAGAQGLGLQPGDRHYRAYVGPPADYDLVAAMSFGLLVALGMRQHHRVLDIGCGSLRVGRLLIPYLNPGHYVGHEPNAWLVEEGIERETGRDQVRIKSPRFVHGERAGTLAAEGARFDYLLAQSIFSHTGPELLDGWLADASALLSGTGALAATYVPGPDETARGGWVYPECVTYGEATLEAMAARHGLRVVPLQWHHPRQRWLLFAKPGFDADWFAGRELSWNGCFDRFDARRQTADGTTPA